MTKGELLKRLESVDDYAIVVCMDVTGGWDNIIEVVPHDGITAIVESMCSGISPTARCAGACGERPNGELLDLDVSCGG